MLSFALITAADVGDGLSTTENSSPLYFTSSLSLFEAMSITFFADTDDATGSISLLLYGPYSLGLRAKWAYCARVAPGRGCDQRIHGVLSARAGLRFE